MPVKVHPAADAFPMMNAEQFAGLKADIEERGQQEAIVYWQGQLIDGRNRLKACRELKIEPTEAELDDDQDPVAYIVSANLHRRHLTTSQRSTVAAKLSTMKRGDAKTQRNGDGQNCLSQEEVSKLLQVSAMSVKNAKHVLENGSKELFQAVENGEVNLNQATNLIKAVPNKTEQTKIVREGKEAIKAAAKPQPKPKRKANPKPDPEPTEDDGDYVDDFAAVFAIDDQRISAFKRVFDLLQPHEVEVVRGWLE